MRLRVVLPLAAVIVTAACSPGSPGDTSAAPQPAGGTASSGGTDPTTGCDGAPGGRPVSWSDAGGPEQALVYAPAGSAPTDTAVVVSNQSDQTRCSWAPYLGLLQTRGVVWLYDDNESRTDETGVEDVTAVTHQAVAAGAHRVILVGASKGAKASLVAAATLSPPPLAVVALSPEANLADGTAVLDRVKAATFPTLVVVADDDPYQAAPASHALASSRPTVTTLVTVPGSAHGTALLTGPSAAAVSGALDEFLDQHKR